MSALLEISGLSFSYGKNHVFKDLDFSVSDGEVVCLMGPNGSGKTTLLDCIMALKNPQKGTVRLRGQSIKALKRYEIAQQIAFVPQLHDVTFPYTVRDMVLMGRTAYTGAFRRPSEEDERITMEVLERIGIEHFADRPYSRLSGGEIKLVLLARALGQKTPLLLLDEPTAHLDFRNELKFLETIVSLCRTEGITVIIATHAPEQAFYFAAKGLDVKAAMMSQGAIKCFGSPDDIITAENIHDVYGVKAKIIKHDDDDGDHIGSSIMLLETG